MNADTLVADTVCLSEWARSGKYDYMEQVSQPQRDLLGEWLQRIEHWLNHWATAWEDWTVSQVMAVVAVSLLLLAVVWVVWRNRYRKVKTAGQVHNVDFQLSADTIYGIDFDCEIRRSYADGLYDEVVRLCYLKYLRHLSDTHVVNWSEGHTPDYYVQSVPPGAQRARLRKLTDVFVRVRFGHYPASRECADEVRGWTEKGGEA